MTLSLKRKIIVSGFFNKVLGYPEYSENGTHFPCSLLYRTQHLSYSQFGQNPSCFVNIIRSKHFANIVNSLFIIIYIVRYA